MTTTLDLTELDQDVEDAVAGAITDAAGTEQTADPDAGSLDLADDSAGPDAELRATIPALSTKLNILGIERSADEISAWSDDQIREVTIWAEAMDRAIEADPEGEMPTMPGWLAAASAASQDARSTAETTETPSDRAGVVPGANPEASAASGESTPDLVIETTGDATGSSPATPKPGQGASLAEVKASIQRQMVEKLRRLRAAELLYEEAKEEAAERKKTIKAIQRRLNQLVQDLADAESGEYQQLIPGATVEDDPDPEPADPVDELAEDLDNDDTDAEDIDDVDGSTAVAGEGAGAATSEAVSETQAEPSSSAEPAAEATPQAEDDDYGGAKARAAKDPANHTSVREIGLTESQFEKLGAHEPPIDTVADLERAIRDGYLQKVKGIGASTIDKITDKLMDWRVQNPVVA